MAYEYLNWTFKRNFENDVVTHHLIKSIGSSGWDSRAYVEDVWSALVPNAGIKNFHNDNPGEITKYAVGLAQGVPNNVLQPNQLKYGLYYHDDVVEVICDGTTAAFLVEKNSEYEIKFDAVGELDWLCDGTVLFHSSDVVDFTTPYHIFTLANIAYETELELQTNLDGTTRLLIYDVTYLSSGVPVSVYGNSQVPNGTEIFSVMLSGNVDPDSVNENNIKVNRLLRPGEDPLTLDPPLNQSATRVPIDWIAPYEWSTDAKLNIFVKGTRNNIKGEPIPQLVEGDTVEMIIGSYTDPLLEFAGTGEFEKKVAIFKFEGALPTEADAEQLGEFFNDIYFKLRNLDALIDVDKIIYEASNYFDFQYKVSEYDAEERKYNKVYDPKRDELGLEDTDRVIKFQNSQTIEELFVKQYLPEYIKYMNDINNPVLTLLDSGEIQDLKSILFKNITMMNYFKGNRTQMEFLISIFSSAIGYYYVSVDPDPYYNFIYRVSTTLPKRFWTDDIKDITHPLGWNDFYVEVPLDATAWHQLTFIADGTDAEAYFEQRLKVSQPSYIDFADYLDSTSGETIRYGTYTGNAIEDDFLSPTSFPFKPQEYLGNVDYGNALFLSDGTVVTDTTSGLFHELINHIPVYDQTSWWGTDPVDDQEKWLFILNKTTDKSYFRITKIGPLWKFEFLKSGIGAEYIWEVERGGTKQVSRTHLPVFYYGSSNQEAFRVNLRLKMKDWTFTPFVFHADGRELASMKLDYRPFDADSYLTRSVSERLNRHDGAMVGDFGSPATYPINDGEYTGTISDAGLSTVATDATISTTSGVTYVYFNDTTIAGADFNHIGGMFTEFEWVIRNSLDKSGTVINRIRTTLPSLTYTPATLGQRNIEVILHRGEVSYGGPDKII